MNAANKNTPTHIEFEGSSLFYDYDQLLSTKPSPEIQLFSRFGEPAALSDYEDLIILVSWLSTHS